MEFKPIDLDRILLDGPEAEPYVFTYRPDLSGLVSSIETAGLLVPPLLQEDASGACRLVSGSCRIEALRQLGRKSVNAFVAAPGEMTDADCLSRSISENRWHRGFNEVEKALLFTRLKDRYEPLLPRLTNALGEDLRVPRDERALEPYRFLLSLPESILKAVARGKLALAQALLLRGLPAEAVIGFARIMTECGLTIQESRNAAAWTREAAGRQGKDVEELLKEQEIQQALSERSEPRQRASRLLSILRELRYPLMESWKARFASAQSQISGRDSGIRISHDPTFETTRLGIQIQAASESEFNERLGILNEAAGQGKITRLFEALSVDQGESPESS